MGRLTEVNQSTGIAVKLFDGATDQFPRARIYNAAGTEQTSAPWSSPISLTHRANGYYSASVTPDTEGEFFVIIQVYSDAGFTTLNKKYEEVIEVLSVRSVDQDLATLLTRLTSTRAGNLDNLTALGIGGFVWDRLRSAHAVASTFGESVRVDNSGLQDNAISAGKVQTDTITAAKIAADAITAAKIAAAAITAAKFATDAIDANAVAASAVNEIADQVWDELLSGHVAAGSSGEALARVDVTVSSRESEASASSRASTSQGEHDSTQAAIASVQSDTDDIQSRLTTAQADLDDLQLRIGTPAGASVSADIAAVKAETASIQADTNDIQAKIGTPVGTLASDIAGVQSDTNDIQSKIGTPAGASVSADIAAVKADTAAILDDTGTSGVVIASAQKDDIVDRVWDETLASHVAAGSMGFAQNTIDDIFADTDSLDTVKLTTARADNLDDLDVPVSSRESEASAASRAVTNQSEHDTTQSAIAAVNADTDDIQSRIGTPALTLAQDIASIQADTDDIQSKIGTPAGVSVSADIAAVKSDTTGIKAKTDQLVFTSGRVDAVLSAAQEDGIVDKTWDESAAAHTTPGSFGDYLDDDVSTKASQASVDGIQNNTNFVGVVPSTIVLPSAGSKTYRLYARLFDTAGSPEDPDLDVLNIRIEDAAGAPLVATVAMTRDGVGQYHYDYLVNSTDTEQPLRVFFEYEENAIEFQQVRVSEVQEFESKIDTLISRVGVPNNGSIAQDVADVKSVVDQIDTETDAASIAAAVWDELKSGHNTAGTFGEAINDISASSLDPDVIAERVWRLPRPGNTPPTSFGLLVETIRLDVLDRPTNPLLTTDPRLNNLDVPVGTRESTVDAAARAALNAKQTELLAVKGKTDQLAFTAGNVHANIQVNSDKTDYTLSTGDKADIADRVWDEASADHLTAGTTGKALVDAQASPGVIAAAVWDLPIASHTNPDTFGAAAVDTLNESHVHGADLDTLKERLSDSRADALDYLNAPIASLETEASAASRHSADLAEHGVTQAAVAAVASGIGADPNGLSIIALLTNATYGLANLRIQLDTKATQVDQLLVKQNTIDILSALADGSFGLAALKAAELANKALLEDGGYGLSAIKGSVDTKASAVSIAALPNVSQISTGVWNTATGGLVTAGSIGKRIADLLDASISSRATSAEVAAVEALATQIKALLEHGTYGLSALKNEIDANEALLGTLSSDVANVDSDLAAARADILADIAALIDGTPTILAALDTIKGASFAAGDDLHSIRLAIGAGSATLANQVAILAELSSIKGVGWTTETLKSIKLLVDTAISDLAAARSSIEAKADAATAQATTSVARGDATISRLDDVNFGLSKAKADRDAFQLANQTDLTAIESKVDILTTNVSNVDADLEAAKVAILAAIAAQDTAALSAQISGVAGLLTDGGFGLNAIRSAITVLATQLGTETTQIDAALAAVDAKIVLVQAALDDVKGVGFDAGDSLKVLKEAVEALDLEHDDLATSAQAQQIVDFLNIMKDGNTGDFVPETDSLHAIAQKNQFIEGFESGGA